MLIQQCKGPVWNLMWTFYSPLKKILWLTGLMSCCIFYSLDMTCPYEPLNAIMLCKQWFGSCCQWLHVIISNKYKACWEERGWLYYLFSVWREILGDAFTNMSKETHINTFVKEELYISGYVFYITSAKFKQLLNYSKYKTHNLVKLKG